jgi:dCTP deaminase
MLTGDEILKQVKEGNISISPFRTTQLQANSYDVRLGKTIVVVPRDQTLDVKKPILRHFPVELPAQHGYVLQRHNCYLAATEESIRADNFIMELEGRSTLARYFLSVHQTAGFGDIGFCGHWTLELVPAIDIRVYPGIRIAQISFHRPEGETNIRYGGRYVTHHPEPKLPEPDNV